MKLCILSLNLICLVLSMELSCAKHDTTRSRCDPNILIFSSFEKNGCPSLAGWTPDDTTLYIQFSRDVPPNGGHWSLSIKNGVPGVVMVIQTVPALQETTLYQLSFWAKAEGIPGYAILSAMKPEHLWIAEPFYLQADSVWRFYSISKRAKYDAGISIVVGLSGISTKEAGTTYFDLVKLEKVD